MDYYSKSGNGPTGKNKSVGHLLAFRQQLWLLHCNQTVVMIFRLSSAFPPLIRLAAHKCLYNKACFYSDWQTFRSLTMLSSWFFIFYVTDDSSPCFYTNSALLSSVPKSSSMCSLVQLGPQLCMESPPSSSCCISVFFPTWDSVHKML